MAGMRPHYHVGMQLIFRKGAALRTAAALLALAAALALPGCARYYYGAQADGGVSTDLVAANYRGVDTLLKRLPQQPQRLVVATLVPLDPMATPSRLGRLFSEQIAGRLVQRGHVVSELKLGGQGAAQTSLSGASVSLPALQAIGQQYGAQAVVLGTYAVSQRTLYVSLKMVSALDNTVLAASDYSLAMDNDMRRLLAAP